MNLTTLELAVLDCIALNLYQPTNGDRPRSFEDVSAVWSADITFSTTSARASDVAAKSLPGVCASLARKGFTISDGFGKDASIELTRLGFDEWQAATTVRPTTDDDRVKQALGEPNASEADDPGGDWRAPY